VLFCAHLRACTLFLVGPKISYGSLHTCWLKTRLGQQCLSIAHVEILSYLSLAHIRFQKFLEFSKHMCVSPCDMQLKFFDAQRQEVGAKFSPTWTVGRDVDQHIRWGVAPLGNWVIIEVLHARSSSSSLARLVTTRIRRGLRNWASEPSLFFCCTGKPSVWPSLWRTRHS
jgi:hypothetical protein